MANFSIKLDMTKEKTTVDWTYKGSLRLTPRQLFVSPGFVNEYDAQSFALSALLPLAAVANESIEFEHAVPRQIIKFWNIKIKSLAEFYNSTMRYSISPVGKAPIGTARGSDVALLMGCGADSLSTLGVLLDQGIKPYLVLIEEREHAENYPDNLREKFVHQLAEDLNLPLVIAESNLWFLGRTAMHKYLRKEKCVAILNRAYVVPANDNLIRGFRMFFSALAALPTSVGKIILSSSKEDRSEWFGIGFNYKNDVPYLGVSLATIPWEKKVQQYAYLLQKRPEFIKYQKTCTNPTVQWCGKCWSCHLARCMQLATGYPNPICAKPIKCFDRACANMLESAVAYRQATNAQVIKELTSRLSFR